MVEVGLLTPRDWTAQWLSVEDRASEMDRQAGLCWIWGDPRQDGDTRAFPHSFSLPAPCDGAKIMIARHGPTKVTNVCIDGKSLATVTDSSDTVTRSNESKRLDILPLQAGHHVIAVEIAVKKPFSQSEADPQSVRGIAIYTRGLTEQFKGARWKTHPAAQSGWQDTNYDDSTWTEVNPLQIKGYQPRPPQPAMHLRKEFVVREAPVKARLYATALGAYEDRLNGMRVGDAVLTPEPSQYAKRALYQIYDVTSMIHRGPNVVGFTVGDGWYASFNSFSNGMDAPRSLSCTARYAKIEEQSSNK